MWSIGAITAAVLTGDVVFVDRAHPDFHKNPGMVIMRLAAKCNLDTLDTGQQWRNVGKRAKDCIKRLLILDEAQRMPVKQALGHPWFSNSLKVIKPKQQEARHAKVPSATSRRRICQTMYEDLHPTINLPEQPRSPLSCKHGHRDELV